MKGPIPLTPAPRRQRAHSQLRPEKLENAVSYNLCTVQAGTRHDHGADVHARHTASLKIEHC